MKLSALVLVTVAIMVNVAQAQPGPGRGQGFRGGQGIQGRGQGAEQLDDRHDADRDVFQFLLSNHDKIKRTVKELPNGVETLTESDTPEIAAKIKEHVEWMADRIKTASPIRMRDPLFAEIFKHTEKLKMKHEDTDKGVCCCLSRRCDFGGSE